MSGNINYRQKNGKKTQTTDLSDMRDENCKYSRFLCDLIMEYYLYPTFII